MFCKFNYVAFWKRQNKTDSKNMSDSGEEIGSLQC